MNRQTKDMLWFQIVGMSDLIIHNKTGTYDYDDDITRCNDEVQRLNPHIYNKQDDQLDEEGESQAEKNSDLFNLVNAQTKNKEIGTILMEQELKFMLLRHWTLFDSLSNSTYIVAKMKLWKEPGQVELKRFLATIGVPLEQAKQKYNFMESKIKNELKQKILDCSNHFSLDNVIMNSYLRQIDSKTQISATDMAYSVSSILDSPKVIDPKKQYYYEQATQQPENENANPNKQNTQFANSYFE